jgi:hypothetical protein
MNEIHDAMRISQFLNPLDEVVINVDEDILVDIVPAHSIDESRKYETDEESDYVVW